MRSLAIEDTTYVLFTTRAFATGIPGTLGDTPAVSAYENDSISQITAGITLGLDHDGVTGLNLLTIVATAANGYEDGKDYTLVITAGKVDSVSVIGEVVGEFSIGRIADQVWDEILTGASHNTATSAGRRLRQVEEAFIHANGVVFAVADGHTLTLDGGAVATADYYIGDRLQIVEGTGAGQSRLIVAYSASKVVILDSDWSTNPNTASLYEVVAADVHVSLSDADLASGFVAVASSTTQITLDATNAVANADYYVGEIIVFTHGTGAGQAREITAYSAGRVVTMSPALDTAVSTDTVWHIQAMVSIPEIVNEVLDEALSGHSTAGTLGKAITDIEADTNELQGDDVPGLIAALNNISVADLLTTVLADVYAANGVAPTLQQALMAVHQMLMAFAISGTSLSVKKLDGSTEAFVATLDDDTDPTQAIRS